MLDVWHKQRARAVFPGNIDGDAQIDIRTFYSCWSVLDFCVTVLQLRKVLQCAQQSPGDQVCVRGFSPIVLGQVLVNDASILIQELYRNATLRGGGRNRQTL